MVQKENRTIILTSPFYRRICAKDVLSCLEEENEWTFLSAVPVDSFPGVVIPSRVVAGQEGMFGCVCRVRPVANQVDISLISIQYERLPQSCGEVMIPQIDILYILAGCSAWSNKLD